MRERSARIAGPTRWKASRNGKPSASLRRPARGLGERSEPPRGGTCFTWLGAWGNGRRWESPFGGLSLTGARGAGFTCDARHVGLQTRGLVLLVPSTGARGTVTPVGARLVARAHGRHVPNRPQLREEASSLEHLPAARCLARCARGRPARGSRRGVWGFACAMRVDRWMTGDASAALPHRLTGHCRDPAPGGAGSRRPSRDKRLRLLPRARAGARAGARGTWGGVPSRRARRGGPR